MGKAKRLWKLARQERKARRRLDPGEKPLSLTKAELYAMRRKPLWQRIIERIKKWLNRE
ncbi:MAG: hypothetical protein Q8P44_09700 [Dehalococcoidia bacterium]|nr:hypothetical protein [Dehalococcoidia bacterium]